MHVNSIIKCQAVVEIGQYSQCIKSYASNELRMNIIINWYHTWNNHAQSLKSHRHASQTFIIIVHGSTKIWEQSMNIYQINGNSSVFLIHEASNSDVFKWQRGTCRKAQLNLFSCYRWLTVHSEAISVPFPWIVAFLPAKSTLYLHRRLIRITYITWHCML